MEKWRRAGDAGGREVRGEAEARIQGMEKEKWFPAPSN
jgi:hypothetical protein